MNSVEQAVRSWLANVVVGLGLCPFAERPWNQQRIRFAISEATDENALLEELAIELHDLDQASAAELETTLLILPDLLADFYQYNDFLDQVDRLLVAMGWEGVFQIASFHPDYCFAGAQPDAAENLTNRSPYPILHILREDSLANALDHYPGADAIPQHNVDKMEALSDSDKSVLFPYLFR